MKATDWEASFWFRKSKVELLRDQKDKRTALRGCDFVTSRPEQAEKLQIERLRSGFEGVRMAWLGVQGIPTSTAKQIFDPQV